MACRRWPAARMRENHMNANNQPTPDLSRFDDRSFNRGVGRFREALWLLVRQALFPNGFLRCYRLKSAVLRAFGASVGRGVVIKPGVRVSFPWRLKIGNHVWIGEEANILSLADVTIGNDVVISQRAFLCTGSHDWSDPAFALITRPITIEDGAWIAADVFVAPGVTVGKQAVATAGSVVTHDLPPEMICSGNPCVPVKERRFRD